MKVSTLSSPQRRNPGRRTLLALCSVFALASLLRPLAAQTQDKPADPAATDDQTVKLDTFVVTSLRGSLIRADEIKMNSSDLVDSIVAQDIGKLPDNTVADALQRISGIQVSRSAGEANTVVIRGLPNIETTINGFEVFTGTGRGVSLQDIPAELIAGVDAYKSVGPDKIDGGVAGLIDIRLRRPFDFDGFASALNVRSIYSDQAGKYSYNLSGLVSNRWSTPLGDFGVMLDVSYSKRYYQDQIIDNYVHFGANGETFDIATDPAGTPGFYADNFGIQIQPGDRTRPAADLSLQWKTKSGVEFYSDNLFTGYRNTYETNFFIGIPSWGGWRDNVVLYPAGYDGWNNDGNHDGVPDRFVKSFVAHDTVTLTSKQAYHDTTDSYQGAFGAKWDRDSMKLSAEVAYNVSTFKTRSVILDTDVTSPTQALAITYNDGNAATVQASGVDYANVNNFHLTQLFDRWERSYSDQLAGRADALFRLEMPFVKSAQFGVRYASRRVNYTAANGGGIWNPNPWNSVAASDYPGLGSVENFDLFVSPAQINIRKWWSADSSYLLTHTDTLRTIFQQPLGLPAGDPSRIFGDVERDAAFYGLANYRANVGVPLDGVIGVRLVNTDQSLSGYQRATFGGATSGDYVRTTVTKTRWDLLPTLNGRLKLTNDLLFRYSVTKTITRPNFADLNPATTLTAPGPTLPGQGAGGNPDLNPIKAVNYDLSLEYYFAKGSQATIAGFYKTLDGYVQSYGSNEVINGGNYTVTRPRNTNDGFLEGMEVGYQQFFDFLPGALKGFGLQANYTYIKGQTLNPLTHEKQDIAQVSKNNYNIILIYERGKLSSRLAFNWRGRFIAAYNQSGLQPTTVYVDPTNQLDFSLGYEIVKNLTLTFDATNILGSKYHDSFGGLKMFPRDVRSYDRTYEFGARYRF